MFEKLELLKRRFEEIDRELADPATVSDQKRYTELVRERVSLEEVVGAYDRYLDIQSQLEDARDMLREEEDREMHEYLRSEEARLEGELVDMAERLRRLLVPKDVLADRDVIVEIRAGTGGDEAALFAGDLERMYTRYAERRGWKKEHLSSSVSEMGGFKEVIFSLRGDEVYTRMKFESGVHRVQRVPVTESQGRIHTSTATVAILPEAEDKEVEVEPSDLKVDVFRSTGPGGQSVNTTDSAVRITHIPTGTVVTCQDEKSQLQNKEKALRILKARLQDAARKARKAEEDATRRNQVGTGERSEKIRTYNFPQGRVTDHRVGLTVHRLNEILDGDIDELVNALLEEERSRALGKAGR